MTELEGYRCPNCGQMLPISRTGIYKCQYCGSEYVKKDRLEPLHVEVCNVPIVTLRDRAILDDYYLRHNQHEGDKTKYLEYTLSGLARRLSEQIVPFMEVRVDQDIARCQTILTSDVRVARPLHDPIRFIGGLYGCDNYH